jgi:hypothetical protein
MYKEEVKKELEEKDLLKFIDDIKQGDVFNLVFVNMDGLSYIFKCKEKEEQGEYYILEPSPKTYIEQEKEYEYAELKISYTCFMDLLLKKILTPKF